MNRARQLVEAEFQHDDPKELLKHYDNERSQASRLVLAKKLTNLWGFELWHPDIDYAYGYTVRAAEGYAVDIKVFLGPSPHGVRLSPTAVPVGPETVISLEARMSFLRRIKYSGYPRKILKPLGNLVYKLWIDGPQPIDDICAEFDKFALETGGKSV